MRIAIALFFVSIYGSRAGTVGVLSKLGQIRGTSVEFSENQSIKCPAFLGVPFAKPPINNRRFRKPEALKPEATGFDATSEPPECIQIIPNVPFAGSEKGQSEDCLYLNLILPPGSLDKEQDEKYPVMVWFHGGAFLLGSISAYYPSSICGNLASRNVIVVSVQYRLGIFGFLALEGGNWGLHDQIQALRWIQENIESFGGDPERVTIFGHSAGGGSVSLLTYIPEARPLFAQAISLSGSSFAYWVLNQKAPHASRRLAQILGCTGTLAEQAECMRQKSIQDIGEAHLAEFGNGFWGRKRNPNKVYLGSGHETLRAWSWDWVPTIDGDLIPTNIENLAETAPPKPFMTGVVDLESHVFSPRPGHTQVFSIAEDEVPHMIHDVNDFHMETFEDNLLEALSFFKDPANFGTPNEKPATKQELLFKLGKFVYLNSGHVSSDNKTFLTEQLLRLNGVFFMNLPCILEAAQKKRAGHPVWLYNYKFLLQNFYPDNYTGIKGAAHGDDMIIFNPTKFVPMQLGEDGRKVRENMCKMLTDFAKNGAPMPEADWPQFESLEKPIHLEIDKELSVKRWGFHAPNIPFWTELAPIVAEPDMPKLENAPGKQEL